jgi:hypothetical protein
LQDVSQITLFITHAFIVDLCIDQGQPAMLFLAAIARFTVPREPQPEASVQSRLGHAGLTVIAVIYVLISLCQR